MSNTPMEKIKANHSIKAFLKDEQRTEVEKMLNLSDEDLERMVGKEAECEFLFRSYCLGEIKEIIAFEEGVSRLTKTSTSDFLFIMKNGRRLAVEVKTTKEDKWSISKGRLKRQRNFAEIMHAELYFAIRSKGKWMFFSADYIEKMKFKIVLDKDYLQSEFKILGEITFLIEDSIKFLSTYSSNPNRSLEIDHPYYGYLERYSIEVNKEKIFKITPNSKEKIIVSIILEAIQDLASKHNQEVKNLDKDRTLVIEKLNKNSEIKLSDLLIAPILHLINDLDILYDYSGYITDIVDATNDVSMDPELVLAAIGGLIERGVKIKVVR
ncbi:hypothetical protein [Bacillus sp. Brlt_9]|uniref:hypothetical protein n=1 Tax=Bacillus sp. Brlt_9 TaxID=3110916 RepID=UPI003F7BE645